MKNIKVTDSLASYLKATNIFACINFHAPANNCLEIISINFRLLYIFLLGIQVEMKKFLKMKCLNLFKKKKNTLKVSIFAHNFGIKFRAFLGLRETA